MREMDPSKHIPIDDKTIEKDNCRSHWSQRFTLVILMSIIYMFGLVYYNDFYKKGVENTAQEYGVVQSEDNMPIKNNAQDFEKAKALIEEGMAKWEDLDYVDYTAKGSDGDEIAYFKENYLINNVDNEFRFSSNVDTEFDFSLSDITFVKKDGEMYKYTDGKKQVVESHSFTPIASLQDVKVFVENILRRDNSGYDMDVNIYDSTYQFGNQAVTYVEINYFKKQENNALSNIFKVYADVTYDKLSIEMIIDSEGKILQATLPHAYSEMKLYFYSYNEPLEIKFPEEDQLNP